LQCNKKILLSSELINIPLCRTVGAIYRNVYGFQRPQSLGGICRHEFASNS
jgi:hypothetical protein